MVLVVHSSLLKHLVHNSRIENGLELLAWMAQKCESLVYEGPKFISCLNHGNTLLIF